MKNILTLTMASTILAISACSSTPVKKEAKFDATAEYERVKKKIENSNLIAPGFVLHVDHSSDSKVTGEYEVDFDGNIKMPYKVTVKAAGLSAEKLSDRIEAAYKSYFKGSNRVSVDIRKKLYSVEVRGDVQKPGRYAVRLDTSLEELVSEAGGFAGGSTGNGVSGGTSGPRPDYLRIERNDFANDKSKASINWFQLAEYFYRYDTESEFLWRGGEKVIFQKTAPADADIRQKWQTITVMGEVREPKEHPVLPNADLLTYITRSGGPTASADLSQVEIIRRADDDVDTVSLSDGRAFHSLKAGDIVMIRAIDARPSTFDKTLTYLQVATGIATSVFLVLLL